MSDVRDRNLLYARLEAVLGAEPAAILMQHLPTHGDPATKSDLRGLETALSTRMDALEVRMDALETRMDALETRMDRLEAHMVRFDDRLHEFHGALRDQTRNFILSMSAVMAVFAGVVVATGILT